MSYEAQAWARKIRCGTPSRKAVLMLLANCADQDGRCWPTVRYIAESAEFSERTVQQALTDLESMGFMEREARKHESGASRSNLFRLKLEVDGAQKTAETPPQNQGGEGAAIAPPGVQPLRGEGAAIAPLESPIESSITPFTPQVSKSITDDDLKAAKWMADRVAMIMPKAKPPNLEQWANDIRLIRTQDGHDHREICKVFAWANNDQRFWWRVILSPRNLRKHFPRLYLEANVFQKPDIERPMCLHCPNVASLTVGNRHYCAEHAHLVREQ